MINKITNGYVIQQYNDKGKCVSAEFVAGDVDYEDAEDGEPLDATELPYNLDKEEYYGFNMVQPR